MLYLDPPFYFIDNVTVFRDHEDPLQYYFLPAAPRLTTVLDPTTGEQAPQIQLIEYRGDAGNGGFLNFDVNVGIDPDTVDDIARQIRSQAHLNDKPRLVPAPLTGGTVQLMLLDQKTGQAGPASVGGPAFVTKILQNSSPALYGDNQAAFSVELTQDGVTVLEQALQGQMSPIGVIYNLEYLALRPAYNIKLHIDWARVQTQFSQSFSTDSIFTSSEIDKAIDKLVEDQAIVFEVTTLVPEGEDSSQVIADEKQAEAEVRDMITQAFFQPSLNPEKETKDGWDKAEHLFRTASAVAVTGGWAALGSFSYKQTDYTRIDQKQLNVNMSERTTVKRIMNPQGHLSGLFRPLKEQGMDLGRFVLKVDLNNPWFKRRRVTAVARTDFTSDNIASVDVNLHYGGQPQNVILTAAQPSGKVDWESDLKDGVMQWDVACDYKVTFQNVDGSERPVELQSPSGTVDVENLEINPRQLYSIVDVPIVFVTESATVAGQPPSFPWERYPSIELHVRYQDSANGINIQDAYVLDKDNHAEKTGPKTWKMFIRNPDQRAFDYQLIYHRADNQTVTLPWSTTTEQQVIVRDPFPRRRTVTVVPNFRMDAAGHWVDVKNAFIDLSYEDNDNDISEQASFSFDEMHADPQTFTVDLANPDKKMVSFEASIIFKDGHALQIPPSVTLDRRILLRSDMRGHRLITLQPQPVNFDSKGVKQMTVEINYVDDQHLLSFNDNFVFQGQADVAVFEYDYVNEQAAAYQYRVTYQYTNGLSNATDWLTSSKDQLILPVGQAQ